MTKHFNLADMFEMVADKVPTRSALVCGEQRASFGELSEQRGPIESRPGIRTQGNGLSLARPDRATPARRTCFESGISIGG